MGELLVGLARPLDCAGQTENRRDRQADDPAAAQHVVLNIEQQRDQADHEHRDVAAQVGQATAQGLVFGAEHQLVTPAEAEDRERVTQVFHHCSRLLGAGGWTGVKLHKHCYYTLILIFFNVVV